MQFVVSLTGRVRVVSAIGQTSAEEVGQIIVAHLDEVMDELLTLDAQDPGIDLDLTECHVTVSVLVNANNPLDAISVASGLIRTAIHKAGGSTPDWSDPDASVWSVVLLSVRSEPVPLKSEELQAV